MLVKAGDLERVAVEGPQRWFPVVAFALVASVVVIVSVSAHAALPLLHHRHGPHRDWADAFSWWDGWWYSDIARRGYFAFSPHRQSPVAFFPAYPLLMRVVGAVVGGPLIAGVVLSLGLGLGDAVAFYRWCRDKLGAQKARLCLLVLLLYPFAFYLMGAVYADGLFLLTTLAAFLALEADRPVLAGLAAAVATASRPVGAAVVLGLWVLAAERSGIFEHWRHRLGADSPYLVATRIRLRSAHAGLLLAPLGLAAYCAYLGERFGSPLAFIDVAGAPGWGQAPGPHTWLKVPWFKAMVTAPYIDGQHAHLAGNALATVVVVAFLPLVFRKFGLGYGVFASAMVLGAAVSTKDFVGMGRYCLAAFPCFAAAGDLLSRRPRLAVVAMGACGGMLLLLTELHARGTLVS